MRKGKEWVLVGLVLFLCVWRVVYSPFYLSLACLLSSSFFVCVWLGCSSLLSLPIVLLF